MGGAKNAYRGFQEVRRADTPNQGLSGRQEPRQPPAKLIVHCRTGSLEMARLEDIPEDQRSLPYRQLRKKSCAA